MARLRPVGDWIAGRFEIFAVHPGGMGVVYVAIDHQGSPGRRTLAIKTLRDEWLADPEWTARFAAEGELWVALGTHPNIVHAYSVEEFDGKPYILLELVTGGDLRRRINSGSITLPSALHLGIQFCLGMEHATRQGLQCHRDVKPGNLMIDGSGTLKITDFGLAVIRDELHADGTITLDGTIPLANVTPTGLVVFDHADDRLPPLLVETPDPEAGLATTSRGPEGRAQATSGDASRLTQTGSLLGTLPYMAPEQFRDSKAVDVRADIYAFGVVLFRMLAGELPFHGQTVARLDRAHSRYTPPSVIGAIPRKYHKQAEAVDEIIQRCLKKEPDERYATIEDLRRALTRVAHRIEPKG